MNSERKKLMRHSVDAVCRHGNVHVEQKLSKSSRVDIRKYTFSNRIVDRPKWNDVLTLAV